MNSTKNLAKWAFITGASSGIGKAFSYEFGKQGYNLVNLARRAENLDKIKREVEDLYQVKVINCQLDLLKDGLEERLDHFFDEHKLQVDVVINNAGCGFYDLFVDSDLDLKQRTIDLNVSAATRILHYFLPKLLKRKTVCHICNVSSLSSIIPVGHFAVYSATKAYLSSLSEVLAAEVKGSNVKIMHVNPGGVQTEFLDKANQELVNKNNPFMDSPETVARKTLKALFKNKRRYVPGWANKLSVLLFKIPPKNLAIDLAYRTMQKNAIKKQ
ncbi:MAG: SDR family oxidoreductase [Flavobacteriales bacterium]|nr:SDR family oxidoreductase [Flavobacteriales bacterium]